MNLWRNLRVLAPPWLFPLLFLVVLGQRTEIPDELDPFLELLFETSECESVVANEAFLVVETRKCKPFTCNFPFEACMRPSHLLNEEKANQCRSIPDACLTAANGGNSISKPSAPTSTFAPTPPSTRILGSSIGEITEHGEIDGDFEEAGNDGGELETSTTQSVTRRPPPRTRIRPNRLQKIPVCDQGIPNGRFCGFRQQWTYNKETGNCEQFWFPGCKTEDTNDNLFDSHAECKATTKSCLARPHGRNRNSGREELPEPQLPVFPTDNLAGNRFDRPDPQVPVAPPESFVGNRGGRTDPNPNFYGQGNNNNQFKGFMEWAGSALGGANGAGGIRPSEYGGGELGSGHGVTQPPNLIRFIANTIRDVGSAQKTGKNGNSAARVNLTITKITWNLPTFHQHKSVICLVIWATIGVASLFGLIVSILIKKQVVVCRFGSWGALETKTTLKLSKSVNNYVLVKHAIKFINFSNSTF